LAVGEFDVQDHSEQDLKKQSVWFANKLGIVEFLQFAKEKEGKKRFLPGEKAGCIGCWRTRRAGSFGAGPEKISHCGFQLKLGISESL